MREMSPLRLYEYRLIRLLAQQLVQNRSSEPKARLLDCSTSYLADADDYFLSISDDLLEADPSVLPSQMLASLRWAVLQAFYLYHAWSSIELDVSVHGTDWFVELSRQLSSYLEFAHAGTLLSDPATVHC